MATGSNESQIIIRRATADDLPELKALLQRMILARLPGLLGMTERPYTRIGRQAAA